MKEIHLTPYGTFTGTGMDGSPIEETITEGAVDTMISNFNKDILLDVDHESEKDGSTRAAGWIKRLFKKEDGLYADVELTPYGDELVSSKEYNFISPVWAMFDNIPAVLKSVALTNRPALPVHALNSKPQDEKLVAQNALTFVANPTCCELCEDKDGKFVRSADVEEVAHPNCKCQIIEIGKNEEESIINNFKGQEINMDLLQKLLKKLGITPEELDAMEVEVKETPAEEVVEEVKEEVKDETENACGEPEKKDESEAMNEEPKEEPVEEEKKEETPVEEVKSEEPVEAEPSEVELLKKQVEDLKAELAANKCKNEEVKEEKKEKEVIPLDALNSAPKSEMVNVKSLRGQALINAIKKNPELVHAFDMEQD